ncbi:MAG: bifunctional folylpolyglutamate synthase/dihydrofolate synthase [Elusimicrobiaceae bacterium]|nr:bifunctional folylpolyglutamate synthase/dihydrofolate synthase [Elusimicrobiaceae bacterium]
MTFNTFFTDLFNRIGPVYGAGPTAFKRLLERLGNPQERYSIIHVAGTNGKGSVCYATAQVLHSAGYRTGLFISPHLHSPTERIQINGRCISKKTLMKLCQQVLAAEEEKLNFFEILTAVAFLYFAEQKAVYVVLETGLGGRKDPTNICRPVVCVITSIGLDHCAVLGNSLAQIAREKAGIIKRKVPVFCSVLPVQAALEIRQAAQRKQAPLSVVRVGQPFRLKDICWQKGQLRLQKQKQFWKWNVLGEKQIQNACLIYQVSRFLGIPESAIKKGFAQVQVPCRFEMIKIGKKRVILDGAHNPQAVEKLLAFWQKSPFQQSAALVCGFMKDKDYQRMLAQLVPHFQTVYVTELNHPRAVAAAQLKQLCPARTSVYAFSSSTQAIKAALSTHTNILVTGSFYVVANLQRALQKHVSHARAARKD